MTQGTDLQSCDRGVWKRRRPLAGRRPGDVPSTEKLSVSLRGVGRAQSWLITIPPLTVSVSLILTTAVQGTVSQALEMGKLSLGDLEEQVREQVSYDQGGTATQLQEEDSDLGFSSLSFWMLQSKTRGTLHQVWLLESGIYPWLRERLPPTWGHVLSLAACSSPTRAIPALPPPPEFQDHYPRCPGSVHLGQSPEVGNASGTPPL